MNTKRSYFFDHMDGHDFEYYCARILRRNGFQHVEVTRASQDQGIDIIAEKKGMRYGIQCKNYSGCVGNKAVQEAFAGQTYYDLDYAVVLTNSYFSPSAIELAEKNNVILWPREELLKLRKATRFSGIINGLLTSCFIIFVLFFIIYYIRQYWGV